MRRMFGAILAVAAAAVLVGAALGLLVQWPDGYVTVAATTPGQQYWGCGIQYARVIELQHAGENNGVLLATHELATSGLRPEKPGYDIHISRDGGETWSMLTTVREKETNVQSEFNPHLYELPCAVGDMPEGTLLLAGVSIDPGHKEQTAIRIYRSFDTGRTWEQYSTVAVAGGEGGGVWEPFLLVLPDGRLACYYSDETESEAHSQKLVVKLSEDGASWGEAIDVAAPEDRTLRPGMAVVAQMSDGRFIMTYELVDEHDDTHSNPVYYRFSDDGIHWGDAADVGNMLVTDTGAVPSSAPYVAYVPDCGDQGLLLVTAVGIVPGRAAGNIVYINDRMGDPDAWRVWTLPGRYPDCAGGYSHGIFVSADGQTAYFVNNIPDDESEGGYAKMIFTRYCFDRGAP